MLHYKRLLTSCFGLGFMPIASGTWGSLPVPIIFGLMCLAGIPGALISLAMLYTWICVAMSDQAIAANGKKDPGEVVADEVAGQAVTFIFVLLFTPDFTAESNGKFIFLLCLSGFLLFRFFDIFKPWPCRKLEKLPEGWGIAADDLAAGLYAAIVLQLITSFRLFPTV